MENANLRWGSSWSGSISVFQLELPTRLKLSQAFLKFVNPLVSFRQRSSEKQNNRFPKLPRCLGNRETLRLRQERSHEAKFRKTKQYLERLFWGLVPKTTALSVASTNDSKNLNE